MTEITEVKDTTTIKNIFAKNAELSNALIWHLHHSKL